ncbi:hypothetical protein [Chamaesiphon sp. VAR_48_metabat_403]|uniref:hypothetical protein n=1 Tax=Chamaesiphon sp. VAR_48_metabat_403 TaxID=2964700 RepID=UPI00286E4495|nr:hypothetical protein [Chamaesiphon sp. VAR_48_metabat_403]
MSQLSILRILPLFALTIPLIAFAKDATPIVPMTLGREYTGSLAPSPNNPQGEVCYGLSVEPDTRITLRVKTGGVGIVKFALYDKSKGLQFFHNDVTSKSQAGANSPIDSRFSFPAISEVSQLCLTTTNAASGQQYNFTATAKPGRKSKSRLVLRPVLRPVNPNNAIALASKHKQLAAPTPKAAPVEAPPQPQGEPYCYVGTWQVTDLSSYWLPTISSFTQAKVTDPQMLGYAKLTLNRDGNASFEAVDLEQKYTLKSKETGAKIDRIGLGFSGSASARFQVNADSTLTFSSQNYRRLDSKLNLGSSLKLTGDRLLTIFGDNNPDRQTQKDAPPFKAQYKCVDRENITLQIPLPTGQKSITIALKRIN